MRADGGVVHRLSGVRPQAFAYFRASASPRHQATRGAGAGRFVGKPAPHLLSAPVTPAAQRARRTWGQGGQLAPSMPIRSLGARSGVARLAGEPGHEALSWQQGTPGACHCPACRWHCLRRAAPPACPSVRTTRLTCDDVRLGQVLTPGACQCMNAAGLKCTARELRNYSMRTWGHHIGHCMSRTRNSTPPGSGIPSRSCQESSTM
jgi:hypothetical protein